MNISSVFNSYSVGSLCPVLCDGLPLHIVTRYQLGCFLPRNFTNHEYKYEMSKYP